MEQAILPPGDGRFDETAETATATAPPDDAPLTLTAFRPLTDARAKLAALKADLADIEPQLAALESRREEQAEVVRRLEAEAVLGNASPQDVETARTALSATSSETSAVRRKAEPLRTAIEIQEQDVKEQERLAEKWLFDRLDERHQALVCRALALNEELLDLYWKSDELKRTYAMEFGRRAGLALGWIPVPDGFPAFVADQRHRLAVHGFRAAPHDDND